MRQAYSYVFPWYEGVIFMIYVYMRGRLGNQLFQYAFVRALQKNNPGETVCYIFDDVFASGPMEKGWENSLQYFQTIDVDERHEQPKLSLIAKALMRLYWWKYPHKETIEKKHEYQMKWIDVMAWAGLYYLDLGYYAFPKKTRKNTIVSGNFESERYFSEIKESLRKEIVPRFPLKKENRELMSLIQDKNSVCVSVRRGDFVENSDFSQLLNVCTKQYFERAVDRIKQLVDSPVLFFFSDDIEWVRNNVSVDLECYYERGDDPVWEKLRLMYSCKHFIISNSTFSWWAQYLGQYENKVVIAPERWYNSEFIPDIMQDTWEYVKVDEI